MREYFQPNGDGKEEMETLLQQFEDLRKGNSAPYIEEESFERLIAYFESEENYPKAMIATNMAINQFPYSAMLLIKKADLLLSSRNYDEALELLEQAAIFDNSDIDLYILKTEALLALDRQEEAVKLLQEALEFFEGDERVDLLFELADVYDDYEDFDKVFDCLYAILTQEPGNEEALYKICFWTDFTGRNAESIELHQRIIDEHPYSELAWFNLAAAYQGIKLYEKAIDAYQYAIVIDDKFDYAYRNLGDAYIRIRKYKDAIEALQTVLELSKPEDVIYEAIGYCYEKLKNYAQARFYYRKASHLNTENAHLLYKVAYMYFKEEKFETAVKQLETVLKIKRNKAEYHMLMGECKMQLGLEKDAIQYFTYAVKLRPRSVMTWEALIKSLYCAGYYEDGLEQLKFANNILQQKPVFLYYETALLFAVDKPKQALLVLEEALRIMPAKLKILLSMDPSLLQHQKVADLLVKYKKRVKK